MKLNEKAAADLLGLPHKTLSNWRALGKGPPYFKLGSRVVYDQDELDIWLESQRRVPGTPSHAAA